MRRKSFSLPKNFGEMSALASFAVFAIFTATAIYLTPGFDIAKQYLSELGLSAPSALFFNSGIVISGLLLIPFFISLRERLGKTAADSAITSLGIASSFALMGIGIFTLAQRDIHNLFNYSFLFFVTLTIFFTSLRMLSRKLFLYGLAGLCIITFNTILFFVLIPTAIQKFSVFTLEVWLLTMIFYMMVEEN